MKQINIIGAGLAGSEAANFLANHGLTVHLYEMRPKNNTEAHHTSLFGELVCSNSLKNKKLDNACGLLKEEIKLLGSLMMEASEHSSVPSGDSLAVDRTLFAEYITKKIKENKNIIIHNEKVTKIPEGYTIICTGPLTDKDLLLEIENITKQKSFGFFDASAPIIEKDSIDFSKVFMKSRYNQGDDSYINCPFSKEEYLNFYRELINAKRAPLHDFDKCYFEGCLPIEVIASRGEDTLRYGPLKPKGLENDGKEYYAVVQLRQDDLIGSLYNMVGFQTNLTYSEQKRVFSLIPGLENANIMRYGVMHRNTFINSPELLNPSLQTRARKDLFFAGQITGTEGYTESIASGLLAGINMARHINGEELLVLPTETMLGALTNYITSPVQKHFQPINSNWAIVKEMDIPKKIRKNKKEKNKILSDRALEVLSNVIV